MIIQHYRPYLRRASEDFVPTDIAGCQLWLKAASGITKDGSDYVSVWADQSGNGNDAVQDTGSAQPLFIDGIFNGKPIIRFDGTSDNLILPNASLPVRDFSIFIVSKWTYVGSYTALLSRGQSWGEFIILVNSNWGDNGSYDLHVHDAQCITPNNIDKNNPHLGSFTFDNSNKKVYVDGVNSATTAGTGNIYYNATSLALIGAFGQEGSKWWFCGADIAEIIIYHYALTDTDRQLVETYLNTKYALW